MFYKCGDTLESHAGVGVKKFNSILTAVKRPILSLAISVTWDIWQPFNLCIDSFRLLLGFRHKTSDFGKTLFFDRLEVKFAHVILRNDLISVPLTLFGNCFFRSHKAFTVMSAWKLVMAAESMPLKATENLVGVAIIVIQVYHDTGAKLDEYHRRKHGRSG